MEGLNFIAIAVAALIPLIMGFIWYNSKVFGTVWMQETGITEEKAKQNNMALVFGLTLVLSFLLSFFMFVTVNIGGPDDMRHGTEAYSTFKHGAFHGVFMGILVAIPMIFINGLFEQKSFKYMFINVGYWTFCFALMGGLLCAW